MAEHEAADEAAQDRGSRPPTPREKRAFTAEAVELLLQSYARPESLGPLLSRLVAGETFEAAHYHLVQTLSTTVQLAHVILDWVGRVDREDLIGRMRLQADFINITCPLESRNNDDRIEGGESR